LIAKSSENIVNCEWQMMNCKLSIMNGGIKIIEIFWLVLLFYRNIAI